MNSSNLLDLREHSLRASLSCSEGIGGFFLVQLPPRLG